MRWRFVAMGLVWFYHWLDRYIMLVHLNLKGGSKMMMTLIFYCSTILCVLMLSILYNIKNVGATLMFVLSDSNSEYLLLIKLSWGKRRDKLISTSLTLHSNLLGTNHSLYSFNLAWKIEAKPTASNVYYQSCPLVYLQWCAVLVYLGYSKIPTYQKYSFQYTWYYSRYYYSCMN